MKHVAIDFAPRSLAAAVARTHWASQILGGIAGITCLVGALTAGIQLQENAARREEAVQLQTALQRLQRQKSMPAAPVIPIALANAANRAIERLNLPWRALFQVFETVTPASIGLIALSPEPGKQIVHVTAEARTSDEMIDYVKSLKQQEFFDTVVLIRHEISEQDPIKPIRFMVDVHWQEDKP